MRIHWLNLCSLFVLLLLSPINSYGQMASASKFWPNGLHLENTSYDPLIPGHSYDIFISTGTLPITFSKIVKNKNGDYEVGSQLGLGVGYLFLLGTMTYLNDDNVQIHPGLFWGPSGDIGVRTEAGELKTAFSLGGIIGFNVLAATVGYDFLGKSPYIGLSGKLDFFALKKDSFVTHWRHDRS